MAERRCHFHGTEPNNLVNLALADRRVPRHDSGARQAVAAVRSARSEVIRLWAGAGHCDLYGIRSGPASTTSMNPPMIAHHHTVIPLVGRRSPASAC